MSDKVKENINVLLDKITQSLPLQDNISEFQNRIEENADALKDYAERIVSEDKKQAKKRYNEDKKLKDRKYKKIRDAYNNPLTLSGASNPLEQYSSLNYNNITLNWWLSVAMYDNSGIFKIAVDTLSQDLIKAGVTPILNNVLTKKAIQNLYSKLKPDLIYGLKNAQLFGGAIGVIMFDTITDYSRTPDLNLIAKAKKITIKVYDRWQITTSQEKVSDFMSDDYGLPKYYSVIEDENRSSKLTQVHHGFVIRFVLREAPKIVKDLLSGWGYSTLAHTYSELMKDQQLKYSVVSLINKSLLEVVQMSGMKGLFSALSDPDSQAQLEARLEMVNRYRNNNSLIFLDKEDQYSQFTFGGLSGLADLMDSNKDDLCAILEMSKILLFGDSKGGLSGNADAEYLWYQGKISGKQEEYLRKPLSKLIKYLALMCGIKQEELITLDFKFNSIVPEKEEDRTNRFNSFVDSLSKLKEIGIYTDADIKNEIIAHADEYGIGIATYKLEEIFKNKEDVDENTKKVKYKVRPLVNTYKEKLVPDTPVKVETERLVPNEPVVEEEIKEEKGDTDGEN
jgi:phage-related protein (TIGR01555 family)